MRGGQQNNLFYVLPGQNIKYNVKLTKVYYVGLLSKIAVNPGSCVILKIHKYAFSCPVHLQRFTKVFSGDKVTKTLGIT